MEKVYLLIISIVFWNGMSFAQNDTINRKKTDSLIIGIVSIDKMIMHKQNDSLQLAFLIDFKSKFGNEDKFSVEEFLTHYKIIVKHASSKEYTGGAECYLLDKKTGKSSMSWHEHPMKITPIERIEKH